MDFVKVRTRTVKTTGQIEVYPDFIVCNSKDIMVKGGRFYAIWDEAKGLWSKDEYDVTRLVDDELAKYNDKLTSDSGMNTTVRWMHSFQSHAWMEYSQYINHIADNAHELDSHLTFANTKTKREDYISHRLPYELKKGDYSAWDTLIGKLYSPEERAKLEWAIGSIVDGDSVKIDKFIVLYGSFGSGKSTILDIIQKLFEGYCTTFEAKALGAANNQFATEVFKNNPLVAIQHDGDLSRIEDNTKLNSIVSHEVMTMNEKYKASYDSKIRAFLFMGTNKAVKITDSKSGLIRRLIDVSPTGKKFDFDEYTALKSKIQFELGAIAYHCRDVYRSMGRAYYNDYRPIAMMGKTDVFYNFVEDNYETFKSQDGCSLAQAWQIYKQYCEDALIEYKLPRYRFKDELKNYFSSFEDRHHMDDGSTVRSYYSGFRKDRFELSNSYPEPKEKAINLTMDSTVSKLDSYLKDCPAQYTNAAGTPIKKWDQVTTTLGDLDTTKLHYVKPPKNLIVIDFDIKNDKGEKDAKLNLEAASKWPSTYSEYSQGGSGIHLHYIYEGDTTKLAHLYEEDVEIKTFTGDGSLRRRLSFCNDVDIAHISEGLPLKEEKLIDFKGVKNEAMLRALIKKNLRKEIHPATKPSVDFICTILDEAYESGIHYDVSDMRQSILNFALGSTHNADYCMKVVGNMKFQSEDAAKSDPFPDDAPIAFFDIEVFPNLFLVVYKYQGKNAALVPMINPTPEAIGKLFNLRLVGFNNRKYDNHMLYGRYIGYDNAQMYALSQKLVSKDRFAGTFREAYNISYTDIYDYSSKKQSLKKWEIELGIHHKENQYPWDQPVPEEHWQEIIDYCKNDVMATEAVWNATKEDFAAREILSRLSGLSVNDTTNNQVMQIIFGNDRNPQEQFIYTDLATGERYPYPQKPKWMMK